MLDKRKLLSGAKLKADTLGTGARAFLLRQTGEDALGQLEAEMRERAAQAGDIIDAVLVRDAGDDKAAR